MEAYLVFKDLAIIIVAAKLCGIGARALKAPQVVGEIVAGLLIGPSVLGWVNQSDFLLGMAEIGVVLLMFSAGLETSIEDLKKSGLVSLLIACCGVFIPLILGTILYMAFYGFSPIGSNKFFEAVFIGVILTATSVSITVQTLKELGHLTEKVGNTILNAAIIDDVIGIIVLTFVIGFKNPEESPFKVVVNTVAFFVFAIVIGLIIYAVFRKFETAYPHTRRIPIMGLALCLFLAYAAEKWFGIADITGAYVAGLILCSLKNSSYISSTMDSNSYLLFGPIFFASIGLKTTIQFSSATIILFTIAFVLVGLLSKVIGCGIMAKLCKFHNWDCLKIGVGMMTRGEVALIIAQKGLSVGMIDSSFFTCVIILIIVSSVATPILLKLLYHKTEYLGIEYQD